MTFRSKTISSLVAFCALGNVQACQFDDAVAAANIDFDSIATQNDHYGAIRRSITNETTAARIIAIKNVHVFDGYTISPALSTRRRPGQRAWQHDRDRERDAPHPRHCTGSPLDRRAGRVGSGFHQAHRRDPRTVAGHADRAGPSRAGPRQARRLPRHSIHRVGAGHRRARRAGAPHAARLTAHKRDGAADGVPEPDLRADAGHHARAIASKVAPPPGVDGATPFDVALETVRRVHTAHVPILAGTDANLLPGLVAMVPFGISLHEELGTAGASWAGAGRGTEECDFEGGLLLGTER